MELCMSACSLPGPPCFRTRREPPRIWRQSPLAPVVKPVDTADLKSAASVKGAYEFESRSGHQAPSQRQCGFQRGPYALAFFDALRCVTQSLHKILRETILYSR